MIGEVACYAVVTGVLLLLTSLLLLESLQMSLGSLDVLVYSAVAYIIAVVGVP